MRYKTKPMEVEAIQWKGKKAKKAKKGNMGNGLISDWIEEKDPNQGYGFFPSRLELWCRSNTIALAPTDWLVFDGKAFGVYDDQGFKHKYEECK